MKFLVLLISLFLCSITNAATYYISPAGNDATGNGSILNPWKTLQKATSAVTTPNNIIFVTAGTYIETGTSVLAPGVSIEGEGILSIIKASFSTVFQMIIQAHSSEGTNGNQHISNISMDGQNSTSWAIQIQGRSNFSIHDCIIYNFAQRGIVWGGRDDNGDAPPTIYATGNTFYNNTVTNCAGFDGTYGYGCLNIGGQDGMLIYNNTIVTTGSTPGWPIKLWNDGHIKGCKIYNNTLKRPPFPYLYNGIGNYFDFAIEMFYPEGLEIYGNTIEGSIDLDWQLKGSYGYSVWIHDNVIGRSTQAAHCETGIWLENSSEFVTIERNTFKSISQPIMFSLRPGSYMNDITIQKNLAYNIGKTDGTRQGTAIGIIVNDNSTNYSASNWFVYNNTFLALTGSNAPYFGVNLPGGNSSTNVKLVNNILSNFNYYAVNCDYGSHVNGLQVSNNTQYNNGSNNGILFTNGNPVNYTNTGNLNSNPLLDLSFIPIVGSSPCIDAGINVGLPFSGAAPEMGFFEIGITNIPPTANAGPDKTITLPTDSVTLNGSGNDPDGNITAYKWTKVSGPTAGTITSPNSASTTITGLTQGTYQFELKVTDNGGAIGRDTMQLTVNALPNIPPTANAGPDQTITLPTNTVTLTGSGNDPDGNITAYKWTKISGPACTITNSTSATTTVTGMLLGIYKFELKVTDNGGAIGKDTMQVTVNPDPNIPPTANAGPDQTITLPTDSVTLSGSGNDPDGNITAYQWTKISGPATGTITNPNAASTTVTGLVQGTYQFELKVTDNAGAIGKDTMQVIVNAAPNIPPTADAGSDQTIALPTNTVTLTGTGNDPDGNITAYKWTKISGPACTITNSNSATTTVTGMLQGTYQFELKVTDNAGAVGKDSMQVTVNPDPNIPPTADAGPDQIITLPTNTVTLTGSGTDPDGNITTYKWRKISGPAATITNSNNATTTVTGLRLGIYKFELKVTDNGGAVGRDTMQVTVDPEPNNIPPIADAGPDQTITLPTDSITLSGNGNDPDGNIIAYTWTKISGPAAGTITNPDSATTTVTGLVQGIYKFELNVTDDGGAIGSDTMQVTVNPDPNVPPTANAGPDQTITLPTNNVTLTGSGNDPDGNITAYQWTKISGPAAGTITNPNSASTTVTGLAQGIYKFELKVTDNGGAIGRDTMQVTVNAAPNIPPTANAGPDQTITLPTNNVTLTGSGNDPDGNITAYLWTKISGPAAGTITNPNSASTTVTGLAQGIYKFELKVTDNGGAIGRDTMQVTVNAAPNIPPTANAGPDKIITLPTNNVTLTGSGNDPDGNITAYLWTKISGPAAGTITNPNNASTTVTGLVQGIYKFELKVTDNGGAVGRDTMQVTVNAAPNIPPTANAGPDQTITLPTNNVTLTGSGNDPDGNITAYQWTKISGPAAGTITNPNNATTTVTGLVQGIYKFELKVTDNGGAVGRDTMQVTVNIAPNIPPTANAGPDKTITLPTNTVTLTGSGNDPDGNITAYQWTKISGPAAGTITNPNSASTTVTGLVQGTYKFELKVTDNNNAIGKDTMQVTVNPPPNIPPTANAGPDQTITLPINIVTLAGSGNDPDGNITAYQWTKISGPAAGTITNPGSAITTVTGLNQGAYEFELKVTDNNGATDRDTVLIIITPAPNIPPTANAGPDQTVNFPDNSSTLNGSGNDADGYIARYEWKQLSGPSNNVLFSLVNAVTFINNLVPGEYEFELTVTDSRGATASDIIKVTVTGPPTFVPEQNVIKIFPNPVVDIATLDVKATKVNTVLSIIIFDIQGKIVFKKEIVAGQFNFSEKLDLSKLSKGTYMVSVFFDNAEKQTHTIIKM